MPESPPPAADPAVPAAAAAAAAATGAAAGGAAAGAGAEAVSATGAAAAATPGRYGRRWLRRGALSAVALALAAAGGCAWLDDSQRRWIFQPTDRTWGAGLAAAQGMEETWIDFVSQHPEQRGRAVKLHALWLAQDDAAAPVLLYLHGARWDVRASAPRMRRWHALGFSVLGVDYRGFGRSADGDALPSETLAAEDARAAWQWLRGQRPQARRFVYGHSLGGAIAVRLASEVDDEAGLVVEGAFPSSAEMFRTLRWGWLPVAPLITQRLDAGARIAAVGSPVLVVHGSADTTVPPELGRALFDRARAPKRWLLVDGGSHHNTSMVGQPQLREAVRELFGVGVGAGEVHGRARGGTGGSADGRVDGGVDGDAGGNPSGDTGGGPVPRPAAVAAPPPAAPVRTTTRWPSFPRA